MTDDINSAITRIDWQCEVSGRLETEAQIKAWHHAYNSGDAIEVGGRQCVVESIQIGRGGGLTNSASSGEFWATLREPRP